MKTLRRAIFALIFCLLASTSVWAIDVTIAGTSFNGYHGVVGDTTATLKFFASETFRTSTNEIVGAGNATQGTGFYRSLTCTVSGSTLTCPSVTLPSTLDGHPADATWTVRLYDSKGTPRAFFPIPDSFVLPHTLGSTTTWVAVFDANAENPRPPAPGYPDAGQIGAMIDAGVNVGNPAQPSPSPIGRVHISVAPVDAAHPIAVGKNDYAALGHNGVGQPSVAPATAGSPVWVGNNDNTRVPPTSGARYVIANGYTGATADVQINAADAALGASGDILWYGDGVLAASVVVSSRHNLQIINGRLTSTANGPPIRLQDNSGLFCENWDTTISESTGTTTAASPLNIVADYNGSALNGALSQNITVRGCHFKGHTPVTGTVSFTNASVSITATSGIFTSAMVDATGHWTISATGTTFGGSAMTTIATVTDATHATLTAAAQQTGSATATIIHFNSSAPAISLGNCHNCEVTGNWLEDTHSIGINIGGGSVSGYYAKNFRVHDNLLTGVASQNISATNADGAEIVHNTIRHFSQTNGPGSIAIDIEPNVGDRMSAVVVDGNTIDNSSWAAPPASALGGITVQNGNAVTPYGPITVRHNRIIGAAFSQALSNNIQVSGINVRTAAHVVVVDNYIQRVGWGIILDYSATDNIVAYNTLASCGSGSTYAITLMQGALRNRIGFNTLYNDASSSVPGLSVAARGIYEESATGSDYNNLYLNDADVALNGANSRDIARVDSNAPAFYFDLPAGVAPFAVTSGAAKVVGLDADKLDGGDWAAPGAIGGTTPPTIAATALSATGQITSTLATGTAPFVIASTTPIANLVASNHPLVYNAAGTLQTSVKLVTGTITLSTGSGTATFSGSAVFANTSYICTGANQTNANAFKFVNTSTSVLTATGTGSDVLTYTCIGN
jgi:hypothetical protein